MTNHTHDRRRRRRHEIPQRRARRRAAASRSHRSTLNGDLSAPPPARRRVGRSMATSRDRPSSQTPTASHEQGATGGDARGTAEVAHGTRGGRWRTQSAPNGGGASAGFHGDHFTATFNAVRRGARPAPARVRRRPSPDPVHHRWPATTDPGLRIKNWAGGGKCLVGNAGTATARPSASVGHPPSRRRAWLERLSRLVRARVPTALVTARVRGDVVTAYRFRDGGPRLLLPAGARDARGGAALGPIEHPHRRHVRRFGGGSAGRQRRGGCTCSRRAHLGRRRNAARNGGVPRPQHRRYSPPSCVPCTCLRNNTSTKNTNRTATKERRTPPPVDHTRRCASRPGAFAPRVHPRLPRRAMMVRPVRWRSCPPPWEGPP